MIGTVRQGYNELVLGLSDYYASKWYDVNAAVQKLIDTNQKVAIENL